ncbi:MAG: hypothetical protein PUG48_07445 [Clostridia bacterium]|nr:hypothetical protein [Clostridia bacterium]
MDYEIIFYHSGRTAEIENAINQRLEQSGMHMSQSAAAVSPTELADMLSDSLDRTDMVIIVGGLDGGRQSTENVLSSVLSTNGSEMKSNKIVDDNGNTAYMIRCLEQTILVFPDETDVITSMLDAKIISELTKIYKLKSVEKHKPPIDEIASELDRQLSGISRTRTSIAVADSKPKEKSFIGFKISIAVLTALAAVQLIVAACIYLMNFM